MCKEGRTCMPKIPLKMKMHLSMRKTMSEKKVTTRTTATGYPAKMRSKFRKGMSIEYSYIGKIFHDKAKKEADGSPNP